MTRHVAILFAAVFLIIVLPNIVYQPTVVDHVAVRNRPALSEIGFHASSMRRVLTRESRSAERIERTSQSASLDHARVESTPLHDSVPTKQDQHQPKPRKLAMRSASGAELVRRIGHRKSSRNETERNKRVANAKRVQSESARPLNERVRRDGLGAV